MYLSCRSLQTTLPGLIGGGWDGMELGSHCEGRTGWDGMGPRRPCNYQRSWWALGRQGRATWGDGPRGPVGRVSATWWGPDHTHLTADAAVTGPAQPPHLRGTSRRCRGRTGPTAGSEDPRPRASHVPFPAECHHARSWRCMLTLRRGAIRKVPASRDPNLSTVPQCKASKKDSASSS